MSDKSLKQCGGIVSASIVNLTGWSIYHWGDNLLGVSVTELLEFNEVGRPTLNVSRNISWADTSKRRKSKKAT